MHWQIHAQHLGRPISMRTNGPRVVLGIELEAHDDAVPTLTHDASLAFGTPLTEAASAQLRDTDEFKRFVHLLAQEHDARHHRAAVQLDLDEAKLRRERLQHDAAPDWPRQVRYVDEEIESAQAMLAEATADCSMLADALLRARDVAETKLKSLTADAANAVRKTIEARRDALLAEFVTAVSTVATKLVGAQRAAEVAISGHPEARLRGLVDQLGKAALAEGIGVTEAGTAAPALVAATTPDGDVPARIAADEFAVAGQAVP